MGIDNKYEVVIGLEVHAQLLTKTKAYSSDENIYGEYRYEQPDPEAKIEPIRSTLAGFGFHQVYSNSLQNEVVSGLSGKTSVKMMNPLNREMAYLRTTLLPGLMKAADFNIKNGSPSIRLFECANVHEQTSDGIEGIHEYRHLAGIILGEEELQKHIESSQ